MAKKIKKTEETLKERQQKIATGEIGPNISFSAKKAEAVRRKTKQDILDTSAPPIDVDVNAKDEDVRSDGLLIMEAKLHPLHSSPPDSIVFSMRLRQSLLDHVKQIARERAYREQKNITYQMLISEAVAEKYPLEKK